MTALVWGNIPTPKFETGVDRAVISHPLKGVSAWNGLISVDESEVDGTTIRSYFEGRAYLNLRIGGFYQAVISAFGFPFGFEEVQGIKEVAPGFSITDQKREQFNFSYRTMVGAGYKLHFVHNALLSPTKIGSLTLSNSSTPSIFKWQLDATPPDASGYKPTSHLVIDSTKTSPSVLTAVETLLYGTVSVAPYFPTQQEIINLF